LDNPNNQNETKFARFALDEEEDEEREDEKVSNKQKKQVKPKAIKISVYSEEDWVGAGWEKRTVPELKVYLVHFNIKPLVSKSDVVGQIRDHLSRVV
jgi:hypothetical protein